MYLVAFKLNETEERGRSKELADTTTDYEYQQEYNALRDKHPDCLIAHVS